jgi:hypothetical protein
MGARERNRDVIEASPRTVIALELRLTKNFAAPKARFAR